MRLRDLNAEFVRYVQAGSFQRGSTAVSEAHGVIFDCPGCNGGHSVLVWFRDRPVPSTEEPSSARWEASGSTIDDLTLSPSINLDTESARIAKTCCWHGWVKNGDAT